MRWVIAARTRVALSGSTISDVSAGARPYSFQNGCRKAVGGAGVDKRIDVLAVAIQAGMTAFDLEEMDDLVEESLHKAALWDEVKDDLRSDALGLSLGQQQRLCIARVVAVQPEVILMDESTSALDPIATLRIEELIAELKKDYTIVIVTHNMQQAARVSDYTGLFWLGELVEFSPTEAIFTKPKQELTEAYITGRMG